MGSAWLLLGVLSACSFAPSSASIDDPDAPVHDGPRPDPDMPKTAMLCAGTFVSVCVPALPTQDLMLDGAINTDTSPLCATGATPAEACVIAGNRIHIADAATVTATGSRPLVLWAVSAIDVGGTIDVASRWVGLAQSLGAGSQATCPVLAVATAGASGAGGSGGSFGGKGGDGESNDGGTGGKAAGALMSLTGLAGGCPGTSGAGAGGGAGGRGGGAVALIAQQAIVIGGAINASGAGGGGGTINGDVGGGGGGSGGAIMLDAPQVMFAATARVWANGGGGGEGSGGNLGNRGAESTGPTNAAAGGSGGTTSGGNGGTGSAGTMLDGKPPTGTANPNGGGGGGGGGGAGFVKARGATLGGMISPPAT